MLVLARRLSVSREGTSNFSGVGGASGCTAGRQAFAAFDGGVGADDEGGADTERDGPDGSLVPAAPAESGRVEVARVILGVAPIEYVFGRPQRELPLSEPFLWGGRPTVVAGVPVAGVRRTCPRLERRPDLGRGTVDSQRPPEQSR